MVRPAVSVPRRTATAFSLASGGTGYPACMERRAHFALLAALGCLVTLASVWAAAFLLSLGHWLDAATLVGFMDLSSPSVDPIADRIGTLVDAGPFVMAGAGLIAVALVRGRLRTAAVVPFVLTGASVSTQLLKPAERPLRA